jgi:DNA-binding LacI/PurR family transcriptional regulator
VSPTTNASRRDFRVSRERLAGVFEATARAGLDTSAITVFEAGMNTRENGRRAAVEVLSARPRPTALMCLSDEFALGVLDALDELELTAPHDVSVTGFDDIAAADTAGLTTVRQPAVDKGRTAGQILAMGGAPTKTVLPSEVMLRTSTGPAPGRRRKASTPKRPAR